MADWEDDLSDSEDIYIADFIDDTVDTNDKVVRERLSSRSVSVSVKVSNRSYSEKGKSYSSEIHAKEI